MASGRTSESTEAEGPARSSSAGLSQQGISERLAVMWRVVTVTGVHPFQRRKFTYESDVASQDQDVLVCALCLQPRHVTPLLANVSLIDLPCSSR
uniref:Uncharacterized protein n=1 Tax=Peronospora matthiolae TaxID=2874970 RepID=A0AAV1UYQ0_9STRA